MTVGDNPVDRVETCPIQMPAVIGCSAKFLGRHTGPGRCTDGERSVQVYQVAVVDSEVVRRL
ncbi:MAG TPA: hypothetical protein VGO16_15110 [Pseudonocardiaceae bacterium]|jgi:hypothetical protein|nr:hypothetical protein [Pseudonocardiaceae bacterium]